MSITNLIPSMYSVNMNSSDNNDNNTDTETAQIIKTLQSAQESTRGD